MEERIIQHIDQFFQSASAEHLFQGVRQCWTANVADWSNYLTFDIMGDFVFGKGFGMVQGKESRDLPVDFAENNVCLFGRRPRSCLRPRYHPPPAAGRRPLSHPLKGGAIAAQLIVMNHSGGLTQGGVS
jgi:hypothetical protein